MQKRHNANRKKNKWDEIQIKLHQITNALKHKCDKTQKDRTQLRQIQIKFQMRQNANVAKCKCNKMKAT